MKFQHPNYFGTRDEILRFEIENKFENSIKLEKCNKCGRIPSKKFMSTQKYRVACEYCNIGTKYYKHMYIAKQVWNAMQKGEKHE